MVIQVSASNLDAFEKLIESAGLSTHLSRVAAPRAGQSINIRYNEKLLLSRPRSELHRIWSETSYHMQALRDNPACAQQEYDRILDTEDRGLVSELSFDSKEDVTMPYISLTRPKIAVLREQGVNGHVEMAAAFDQAGFDAVDVTMTDINRSRLGLEQFQGLVACGGFSYGDVLGAGEGWAKSILFNAHVRDQFEAYFQRTDAFALGICNGCQMMSNLKEIVPGAQHWPHFVRNASEQFEARFVQSKVESSSSVLLQGMQGSLLPVVVAHGEGRAEFTVTQSPNQASESVVLSYTDNQGLVTETYPANPNGSPQGIAGLCNEDGRVTIMMPHPERIFRSVTNSWRSPEWGEYSPWMRMFRNARVWVD